MLKELKIERSIFYAALIWYGLTAYMSLGHYHPDEHYQIIEFAQLLDGKTDTATLPWEYREEIRSSFQPIICHAIFRLSESLGISNPYAKAFILRLLTGLLFVWLIRRFTLSCRKWVDASHWTPFLLLSYFLWFLPFLNVRFSSEAWAGMTLLGILTVLHNDDRNGLKHYALVGVLCGVGFLLRYQIAFALIGILAWLLFVRKIQPKSWTALTLSALSVLGIGVLADSWFYGHLIFVPWEYFETNILEGIASSFGTFPWYYYLFFVFKYAFFPLGIAILLAVGTTAYKHSRSLLMWVVIPYLVIHALIGHKELRFLFPIINLVPLILILASQSLMQGKVRSALQPYSKAILVVLFVANLIGLVTASLKPAGSGVIRITKAIHDLHYSDGILYATGNNDPFRPWTLENTFYEENSIIPRSMGSNAPGYTTTSRPKELLVMQQKDINDPVTMKFIADHKMHLITMAVQQPLVPILEVYGYRTQEILVLYGN